ncbi:hypothetical protein ACNJQJ_22500, partial [Mycobacterium tuberculosis]
DSVLARGPSVGDGVPRPPCYYGGCEHVDVVENLARDRAKALFGAEFANVQPHSGTGADARYQIPSRRPHAGRSVFSDILEAGKVYRLWVVGRL